MIVDLLTWLLVWVSGGAAGWHLAMRRTVPRWNREREAFFEEHRERLDAMVDRHERRHRDLRKQLGLEPEELQVIKLSELKAAREAMTPGPYGTIEHGAPYGSLWINAPTRDIADMPDDEMADENANGIVATHNAADAMIAIVEAALAYTQPVETEQDARDKETARRALLAALAKVSP